MSKHLNAMSKLKNLKGNFCNTKFLLFLIVLFGIVLRLIFFSGVSASDDLSYSRYAYYINTKGVDPNSVLTLATRIGLLYPVAFFYYLFGVNDLSSIILIFITAIGNMILAYFFGGLLGNKKIGLMAAFLLAIFPLEVINSTKLLSDIPSAFFMALGVYLFLHSEKKKVTKFFYFLAGISIGIGYLIRESASLIALFFAIYIVMNRKIKKEYFLIVIGFLLIFVVEVLTLYKLTGNPLYRFTTVQDYILQRHAQYNYFGRLSFPEGLLHYPYIIITNSLISYFYIIIFIAIIYFLILKKKNLYTLILWFLPLLLYLSFGSSNFFKYVPFKADPRYLSVITIPGIVLLAFFLTEKNKYFKKIIMPAGLAILLVTSVLSLYTNREDNDAVNNLRVLYPYLEKVKKPIYMDSRSKFVIDYLSGYNNTLDIIEYPQEFGNVKDSYIVINKAMIKGLKEVNKNAKFPTEIDNPPKKWKVVREVGKNEKKAIFYYTS